MTAVKPIKRSRLVALLGDRYILKVWGDLPAAEISHIAR